MDEPLKPKELSEAVDISPSYASMILSGERVPPVPLAISIFRKTGHRFGVLVNASDADIDVLERVHAGTDPAPEPKAAA